MNAVKLIEAKQTRLIRLYLQGSITKTELQETLRDYAQLVSRVVGD